MNTVVVCGCSGFAGSGLVLLLLDRGYQVVGIDILAEMEADKLGEYREHPNFTYVWKGMADIKPKDIPEGSIVLNLVACADVPFGFPSPRHCIENNVMSTIALLDVVKDIPIDRIIQASSGNQFGRPKYIPIDENHPLVPHNPYSMSKCAQEMAFWAWHYSYNVPIVIMSNGIVAGPGMRKDIVLYRWLHNLLLGEPIVIEGDPIADQTRDLTYVTDVLDGWVLAIEAPQERVVGEKFQISYGRETTVEDLANMCLDECSAYWKGKHPRHEMIIRRSHRPGEAGQRECFSNEKAKRVLGYDPKIAPLECIQLTRDWVASEIEGETKIGRLSTL
jgi:nucleoside-diphosphate-sugar epimerase